MTMTMIILIVLLILTTFLFDYDDHFDEDSTHDHFDEKNDGHFNHFYLIFLL